MFGSVFLLFFFGVGFPAGVFSGSSKRRPPVVLFLLGSPTFGICLVQRTSCANSLKGLVEVFRKTTRKRDERERELLSVFFLCFLLLPLNQRSHPRMMRDLLFFPKEFPRQQQNHRETSLPRRITRQGAETTTTTPTTPGRPPQPSRLRSLSKKNLSDHTHTRFSGGSSSSSWRWKASSSDIVLACGKKRKRESQRQPRTMDTQYKLHLSPCLCEAAARAAADNKEA